MTAPKLAEQGLTVIDDLLRQGIATLRLNVDDRAREKLLAFLLLLEKWNRVYNLTAVRDLQQMVASHVLDSVAVIPYLAGNSVLDVGSGAGLPGIPIALACPDRSVTLLDSNHKKAAFLRQAVAELKLANASVACERIESWKTAGRFDIVISRAFSDLGEFVTRAAPLLAPEGLLVAMKGLYPYEEVERLPAGFRVKEVVPLQVPGLKAARHLVLVARA